MKEGVFMKYNIGDRFTSKYYTEFEVINTFTHYEGDIITVKFKRDNGQLSSFYSKKFDEFLKERKYELAQGQITMGVAI